MARNGTPRSEETLIVLLASGASIEEAAEGSGFPRRTAYRRMEDATFRQRIEEAKRVFSERSLNRLLSLRLKHIDNISRLAAVDPLPTDSDELDRALADLAPHAVRLSASKAVVELGSKLRAEHEFERRLRALEDKLAAKEKQSEGGAP